MPKVQRSLLGISFFLLPFFLFSGVAAQTAGLYLCGIVLPFAAFFRAHRFGRHFPKRDAQKIACAFLVLFGIFQATNFFNLVLPVGESISQFPREFHPTLKMLITGRLTTAVFVSSLCLLGLSFVQKEKMNSAFADENALADLQNELPTSLQALKAFHAGVFSAALVWCVYLTYQHLTGFDFRVPGHVLNSEHRLPSGNYRTFGMYGHPLSVGSVGLGLFVFYWFHFWQALKSYALSQKQLEPEGSGKLVLVSEKSALNSAQLYESNSGEKSPLKSDGKSGADVLTKPKREFLAFWAGLSGIFLLTVYLSGGRTTLAVAFLFLVGIPLFTRLPGFFFKVKIAAVVVLLASGMTLVLNSGAYLRLRDLIQSGLTGILQDRATFWKVYSQMISDKPFFGHGMAFIEGGDRTKYYEKLGYSTLHDKFNAHNIYLETVANVGFVGAFLLVSALVVSMFVCLKLVAKLRVQGAVQTSQVLSVFLGALFAAFAANLMHGFTQNVYFDANVTLVYLALFWVFFVSCMLANVQGEKSEKTCS